MSWVAMATRIAGPDNGPCASSSVSMMRSLRVAVMVFSAIPEGIEVIGGGEVQIRLKDIGDLEDQVARALIENGAFVLGAEPIEDWKTDPHERNAETLGGLAAMAVGDKQVAAEGEVLEIHQVADFDLGRRHLFMDG